MLLYLPVATVLLVFAGDSATSSIVSEPHHLREASSPVTQELVDSYIASSGFPSAGRTLDQKIQEATAFLDAEVPLTGTIGTGVAIVYEDQVVLTKGYGLQTSAIPTTKDSMFQIGSVTKTFITVAVGLLVEDGKLTWQDPVKKHLPWLKLFDKYAEEHVTVGDLLSMNSGFAREPDLGFYTGQFKTERAFVEALEWSEPPYSLREIPQYANANFEILGQLIQELSNKSWPDFLSERVWKPLGMDHTFASARLVPAELQKAALADGYLVCEENVLGPYVLTALAVDMKPNDPTGLIAAGSMVSSVTDIAIFTRFFLDKGTVGSTKLFKSPSTTATMITGKNVATEDLIGAAPFFDVSFSPDGDTLAAGYGFDYVGDLMWGHAYVMKGGTTPTHAADVSLAPRNSLGVVFLANTQGTVDKLSVLRSHVMGIFLNVPKDILDFELKKKQEAIAASPKPQSKLLPSCGPFYWKDPPHVTLTAEQTNAFVGTYSPLRSAKFFSKLSVTRSTVANEFVVEFNAINASYFLTADEVPLLVSLEVDYNETEGAFAIELSGVVFQKQA